MAKKKAKVKGAKTAAGRVSDSTFWQSLKGPPAVKKTVAKKVDEKLSGKYLLIGVGFVLVAGVAIYLKRRR